MRSLNTGFDEMSFLVRDFDFDVFAISETWLQPNTSSESFTIPNYTMLRADRSLSQFQPGNGGGVALYIREGIFHELYQLPGEVDPGLETLCVVLKNKGQRLGLCVGYRPPSLTYTSLAALFQSLFVNLAVEVHSVIFLGDTNVDLMSNASGEAKYLCRLLKESNAVQLINEPTRVTATSTTLLDHIIVDRSVEVERTGVIDASSITDHRGLKITDHKLVYCNIVCQKDKQNVKMVVYRDFSNFKNEEALKIMADTDWNRIQQVHNVDEIEKYITMKIKNVYDEQAPVVCRRITRRRTPWMNKELNKHIRLKNKLRNNYWKTKDSEDWQKYKNLRNNLNSLIWNTKKEYFTKRLGSKKDPKELWTCLKQCNILQNKNDNIIPCDLNIDEINRYFTEMGSGCDVNNDLVRQFKLNRKYYCDNEFVFKPVSENDVKSAMNEIKSRAVGSDGLSIQMIKAVSPYALKAITHLINESLLVGKFPEKWKTSIIRPLPKVAAPISVNHLRPISILPAISKILEKIALRQILVHINKINVLPKTQSGFRKSHSTCTALVNLFSDLIDSKDKGRYSSLVMLDYSQAFDSINHELLLAKMHYYGFGKNSVEWVRSYLGDRIQVTKMGSETSAALVKRRGVAQGSCLGPVLFNLYTSDFPSCIRNCTAHLYADDCQLHLSYVPLKIEEAIYQINVDLQSVCDWSKNNGLKLNIGKCSVLHLAPHDLIQTLCERGVKVKMATESLIVCNKVKTLGVVLDRDLSFTDHVNASIQRAVGRLRGLYRFRKLLPEPVKLELIQALVLPVFYYCYPAYGNSISREDIQRIQRLQNTAIRYVFGLSRFDHISSFRNEIKMFPMETVCMILTNSMIHKALEIGEPQYLCERLPFRDRISQRSTRQSRQLHFPKVRLEVGRKSFSYFGPKLYNDLPDCLKSCSSYSFKSKLKNMLSCKDFVVA